MLQAGAFAYDEDSRWALLAVGASAPFSMVMGYGANGRDRGRLPLSGPVDAAPESAPSTAVMTTGVPDQPFLVVWDAVYGRGGAIEGVLVRCGV